MPRGGPDPSPSIDSRRRPFSLAGLRALFGAGEARGSAATPGASSSARLYWAAALAAGAFYAAWAILTGWMRIHNSDSLIPVFAGLYHWTPYFWGQDRYGMAVALLATPIRDPILALCFHFGLAHVFLVLFAFLLARVLLGTSARIADGLLLVTLFILLFGPLLLVVFTFQQPYVQSAVPALAGLLALDSPSRRRRAGGWLLLALAFWIAPTTAFWLAPLLVLRSWFGLDGMDGPGAGLWWKPVARALTVVVLASAVASLGKLAPGVVHTPTALAAPASWPVTWLEIAAGLEYQIRPAAAKVAWLAFGLIAIAALAFPRLRQVARRPAAIVATAWLAAVSCVAVVGTLEWVRLNSPPGERGWRYGILSLLLFAAAPPLAILGARAGAPRLRSAFARLAPLVPLVFVAVLLFRYGRPSLETASSSLEARSPKHLHFDPPAHEALERGVTHLIGEWWTTYPLVFRANSIAHRDGSGRVIWPLSGPVPSVRKLWEPADWADARIGLLHGDPKLEETRVWLGVPPLVLAERGRHLDIYRVASPGARADGSR